MKTSYWRTSVAIFVLFVASLTAGEVQQGSGEGITKYVGGASSAYKVTNFKAEKLEAKELQKLGKDLRASLEEGDQVARLTEAYESEKEGAMEFVSHFVFKKDGTLKVWRNDTTVGCGYYFKDEKGKWMDYRIQTNMGPLHVNAYVNKEEKKVVRMGDMVNPEGKIGFWNDTINLK